jgi:hypothetical protein
LVVVDPEVPVRLAVATASLTPEPALLQRLADRLHHVVFLKGEGERTLPVQVLHQLDDLGLRDARVLLHLGAHRADDSLGKAVAKIVRAELAVIDDVGLLPVGADAAEGLYRIVEAAYERKSVAISSNLHPSGFDELMPKTLATATVDRLLHHAHLCQTIGDSVRLAQALHGKGVKPLT